MFGDTIVSSLLVNVEVRGAEKLKALGAETAAAGKEAEGFGASFAAAGLKIGAGLGLAAAGIAAFSIDAASKFNTATLLVANNTGMTNKQLETMRAEVLQIGKDSPAALDDIARGFEKAANAGIFGAQAFSLVSIGMKAAVEHGGTVVDSVNAVTGVLKEFHQPASAAAKDFGILSMAAAEGDIRFPDLTMNFAKIGTLAGQMHQPLQQVAAAYSTISRFTHSASLTQTLFNGQLSHMLSLTGPVTKEVNALSQASGVDLMGAFEKTKNGTMDLTHFFGTLREVMQKAHLTSGQMADAIYKLSGGMRGGLAGLIDTASGWKDYNQILGKVYSSTDLINRQWSRTMQNASEEGKVFENRVKEIAIYLGEALMPAFQNVLAGASQFAGYVLQHMPQIIGAFKDLGDKIHPIADLVGGALRQNMEALGTDIGNMATKAHDLANWLGQVGNKMQIASNHGRDLHDSFKSMGDSLDSVVKSFQSALDPLSSFSQKSNDAHKNAADLATILGSGLVIAIQAVALALQSIADAVRLMADAFSGALIIAIGFTKDVVKAFQDAATIVSDVIHGKWGNIPKDIGTFLHDALKIVTDTLGNIVGAFARMGADVLKLIADMGNGVVKLFTTLADDTGHKIAPGMVNAIVGAITSMPGRVESLISGMVSGVIGALTSMGSQAVAAIGSMITAVIGAIVNFVSTMIAKGHATATGFVNGLHNIVPLALGAVQAMVSAVLGALGGLAGAAAGLGARVASEFASGIASGVGAVAAAAQNLVGAAMSHIHFSRNIDGIDPVVLGRNLSLEYAQGMMSGIGAIGSAAKAMVASALAGLSASGAASGGSSGASSALHDNPALVQLQVALGKLPPEFQAAGMAVVASFQAKYEAANQKYLDGLAKAHEKELEAEAKARTTEGQKLDSSRQVYLAKVASIHASANEQMRHYLQDHSIAINAANERNLAALGTYASTYLQRKRALENDLLTQHSAKRAEADSKALDALNAAFHNHVSRLDATLGIKTKEQQAMLEEWLKHHENMLNQHLHNLQTAFSKHVSGLSTTESNAIKAAQTAYNDHVKALKAVFDASAIKIGDAIKAATTPSGELSGIQSQVNDAVKNATDQITLDFLTLGHATQADILAVQNAQKAQDTLTLSTQKATEAIARANGDYTTSINDLKNTLDGALQQALDRYTFDLINHTGSLDADTQSILTAQTAVDNFTAAQNKATAVIPVAAAATAANTTATQQNTAATTQQTAAVVQSFSQLQSAAQATASTALDALATAIMTGSGNINQLSAAAIQAANNATAFAQAMAQAQAIVTAATTQAAAAGSSAPAAASSAPTFGSNAGGSASSTISLTQAQGLLSQATAQYAHDQALGAGGAVLQNDQNYVAFYQQMVATLQAQAQAVAYANGPSGYQQANPNTQAGLVANAQNAANIAKAKWQQDSHNGTVMNAQVAADAAAYTAALQAVNQAYMGGGPSASGSGSTGAASSASSTQSQQNAQIIALLQKQLKLAQDKNAADNASWKTLFNLYAQGGMGHDVSSDQWLTKHINQAGVTSR